MNKEQQIKALAELDGWTWRKSTSPYQQDGWWSSDNRGPFNEREMIYSCNLHKMLTSYDAIIPLIQKQPCEMRQKIACQHTELGKVSFMSTPSQLCEALLRATGKWTE